MRDLTEELERWLESGGCEAGEVSIERAEGCFELRHHLDRGRADLAPAEGAAAARHIANFDSAGAFRPLKTAPTLRRGWRLRVRDTCELRRALDYFYPAMLGIWFSQAHGELATVNLRDTLARQTGMYRVTQAITDADAQGLIGRTCRSDTGCLKHILWRISPDLPISTLAPEKLRPQKAPGALPLLCHEACNLLVARARAVVKAATPAES